MAPLDDEPVPMISDEMRMQVAGCTLSVGMQQPKSPIFTYHKKIQIAHN